MSNWREGNLSSAHRCTSAGLELSLRDLLLKHLSAKNRKNKIGHDYHNGLRFTLHLLQMPGTRHIADVRGKSQYILPSTVDHVIYQNLVRSAGSPSNAGAKHLDIQTLSQCALASLFLPPRSRKQQTGIPLIRARCRRDFPHTAKRLRETCLSEIAFVGSPSLIICPFLSVLFYPLWNLQKKNRPRMGPGRGAIAALLSRSISCITSHNPVRSSTLLRVPRFKQRELKLILRAPLLDLRY